VTRSAPEADAPVERPPAAEPVRERPRRPDRAAGHARFSGQASSGERRAGGPGRL